MIRVITGDFGSGKSEYLLPLIRADVEHKVPACLLVPEQQTVLTEGQMADLLPPSAPLTFEVSNFTRLANTVFRRVGGLSYRYAGGAARTLFMWRAMGELLPLLHEKGSEQELGRVRKMTAAMGELSALSLSPGQLSRAAEKLEKGTRLREKVEDLSLLSGVYHSLLSERYQEVAADLDRLGDLLAGEEDLLPGMHVYLDGFISFTEQEWRILRGLARRNDLTVTLTLPAAREDALTYTETKETLSRLQKMGADARVPLSRTDLGDTKRAGPAALRAILPSLFAELTAAGAAPVTRPVSDEVRLFTAPDAFAAAEWIAADIARRVREGARYRDFAIVARRARDYAGILDVCLSRGQVPCFMAKENDIAARRAVKLIFSAYAVVCGGYARRDVLTYLKCGMSGIPQEDIDIFELYVHRWKLEGRRFTDEGGWNMHPAGYTESMSARDADILCRVEETRKRLLAGLSPLAAGVGKQSVPDHCRTLYAFLSSLDVEGQIEREAAAAKAAGHAGEAEELSRLFSTLLTSLEELSDILPDVTVTGEQFTDLLRLLFSEVSLSRIPTAVDEVTVGSADLLRLGETKHIYLLGVNEGEFPAPVGEDSIFSEGDRRALQAAGLSVSPDLLARSAREYFCFARAFAAAGESVTAITFAGSLSGTRLKPSVAMHRLASLCGMPIRPLPDGPLDLLYEKEAAADRLGILYGTAAGASLAACLADTPAYARAVARVEEPLCTPDCHLSEAVAASLVRGGLSLTQSRMDQYVRCPFSYFCRYVLRLDACAEITFDSSAVGNLLHAVLEKFFTALQARGQKMEDLTREEREALVGEVTDAYLFRICPTARQRTPRLSHLFEKLKRQAVRVIEELYEEFSQSDFSPRFFEMDIGDEGEEAPGHLDLRLPSGKPIRLFGRIDRVDVLKKGKKTYLRVIDYKSGNKEFSLENIERGLDTQLLLYLFSLWKSQNPAFRRLLCEEGGELMPAGVLYTAARVADKTYDRPPSEEEVLAAGRSVRRSGLLLDDREILYAMDKTGEGRFIPIRFRKDGSMYSAGEKSLASLERMGELSASLERTVTRIGREIATGAAAAKPLSDGGKRHVCEFCDMKAVCRSSSLG